MTSMDDLIDKYRDYSDELVTILTGPGSERSDIAYVATDVLDQLDLISHEIRSKLTDMKSNELPLYRYPYYEEPSSKPLFKPILVSNILPRIPASDYTLRYNPSKRNNNF